jgi:hypothetical protein
MTAHSELTHRPGHAHPGHDDQGVRSEEDRISTSTIVWVGVGSLVIFFLGALATTGYLRMRQGERPPIPVPQEIGQSKIGMVEQQLFGLALRGERDRAARLDRLSSYGWVDRQAGVAHMPIERAMGLVAGGARPAPVAGETSRAPGAQP